MELPVGVFASVATQANTSSWCGATVKIRKGWISFALFSTVAAPVTVAVLFGSCGLRDTGVEGSGSEPQISNGTVISDRGAAGRSVSSVVAIGRVVENVAGTRIYCTGALISPVHVLTAAHCITAVSQMRVMFGAAQDGREVYARVRRSDVHPQYDDALPTQADVARPPHDLAVLTLSSAAPGGWSSASLATQSSVLPGSLSLAGFGVSETRNVADTGTLRTASVYLQKERAERQTIETSGGTFLRPVGGCAGDSGAPLSLQPGVVAGVLSTGGEIAGKCIGTNTFTDLRYYTEWISGILKADGQSLQAGAPSAGKPLARLDTEALRRSFAGGSRTGLVRLSFPVQRFSGNVASPLNAASGVCRLSADYEMTLTNGKKRSRKWESPLFQAPSPAGSSAGVQYEVPFSQTPLKKVFLKWQLVCDGTPVGVEPPETELNL